MKQMMTPQKLLFDALERVQLDPAVASLPPIEQALKAAGLLLAESAPVSTFCSEPEVVAVIAETSGVFPETEVIHGAGIDSLPVGTELVDRAHVTRLQAEIKRLNSIIEQQKK